MIGRSEGTKELYADDCANRGSIQIWDNGDTNRKFATYNAPEDYRLHIRANYQDYIYFGFGYDPGNSAHNINKGDVWFRVKDPNDSIVFGPIRIRPTMSAGWISSCAEALAGPASVVGSSGYNDTMFIADMAGDYYVEFAEDNSTSTTNKRVIQWFDISIYEEGLVGNYRPGRLWSKQWDINLLGSSNQFMASMYAYSKDSVVSKFDFNGIQPYGFSISCNSFGASNVGTFNERRRSRYRQDIINEGGTPSAPEFPLFINAPDESEFPEGTFGIIDSFALYNCFDTINCIDVYTNKAGQVEMVMNFPNGTQRNIIDTVGPGGNCIEWDGLDGNGNPVNSGDTVNISLNYATGITHLPLMDVEDHLNGFTVEVIRPTHKPNGDTIPDPLLFWDDSEMTDPENNLDGVTNLTGAGAQSHQWQKRGTSNSNPEVINTWWYAALEEQTYIVVCPVLLPVDIQLFTGEVQGQGVQLHWETGIEENIDYYSIERSLEGQHFSSIGSVRAKNFNGSQYSYFDDQAPPAPTLYYRLKIFDFNGEHEYSTIIAIRTSGMADVRFGWSLDQQSFTLASGQVADYHYQVYQLTGQLVAEGTNTTNRPTPLDLPASGLYLVTVQLDNSLERVSYKVIAP